MYKLPLFIIFQVKNKTFNILDLDNKCCLRLGYTETEPETDSHVLQDTVDSEESKRRIGKEINKNVISGRVSSWADPRGPQITTLTVWACCDVRGPALYDL